MSFLANRPSSAKLTTDQRNAFAAAYLGWTMDVFDYFLVVLTYAAIAEKFGVSLQRMAFITTMTLLMRPVGAFLFGLLADRVGRRGPLMTCIVFYSIVGFLCAFAPNFTVLMVLRMLYSIGMGGEWGLGAALAMEKIPANRRGFFSGVLQGGYSMGYLVAAFAFLVLNAQLGLDWRWMFGVSIIPALISLIIRAKVEESEIWQATQERFKKTHTSMLDVLSNPVVWKRFVFLIALMTALNWMSHGTQDVYPTFLKAHKDGGSGLSKLTATWITHHLQRRCPPRRRGGGRPVRAVRPPRHNRVLRAARPADRAAVRLLTHRGVAGGRLVPHAGLRARRVGRRAHAPHRAVA